MARGPIKVPIATREELAAAATRPKQPEIPEEVLLPGPALLDAGVKKFREMANLHWPGGKDGYKSVSFDSHDNVMLRITIGLVYMAMRSAEKDAKDEAPAGQGGAVPS